MTIPESSGKGGGLWRHLPRAWFYLTPNERLAMAVILGLLLLGLGARWWHLSHERSEDDRDQPALRSLGEAGKSEASGQ